MKKTIEELIKKKGQCCTFAEKELVTKGEVFLRWLKELNFEPRLKYNEDKLYIASYLYWVTRIERRVVFEIFLKDAGLANKDNSKRIFKYLYKRLEHSLYTFALRHRKRIKNIKLVKNNWVTFEIGNLGYTFFSGYKLLKALNIKIEDIDSSENDEYSKKIFVTLVDSVS